MQSKKFFIFFVTVFFFVFSAAAQDWQNIEEGLDYINSDALYYLKLDAAQFSPALLYRRNKGKYESLSLFSQFTDKKDESTRIVVNAGFFGADFQPLGLLIQNFETINPFQSGGKLLNSMIGFDGQKYEVIPRGKHPEYKLAVQSGPLLIFNNKPVKIVEKESPARRTALCLDNNNRIIIAISKPDKPLSLKMLQEYLFKDSINCNSAINLDGGSSSQMRIISSNNNVPDELRHIYGMSQVPVFLSFQKIP
jgi:uncharacterized protein YigE (DUF2233 family)